MNQILGIICSIIMFIVLAPKAIETSLKELFITKKNKLLITTLICITVLLSITTTIEWIKFPWLCWLVVLSYVDINKKEVRLIDLIILIGLSLVGIPYESFGLIIIIITIFTISLITLKYILYKIYKQNAFGGADIISIISVLCCLGGKPAIVALYLAVFSSAIVGIILLLFFKANRRTQLPFIPFLGIGSIAAIGYFEHIYRFYLTIIT